MKVTLNISADVRLPHWSSNVQGSWNRDLKRTYVHVLNRCYLRNIVKMRRSNFIIDLFLHSACPSLSATNMHHFYNSIINLTKYFGTACTLFVFHLFLLFNFIIIFSFLDVLDIDRQVVIRKNTPVTSHGYWCLTTRKWTVAK